jgi:prepilin-type N-terminal cleavage/methylation domain-containing protein/prepilin-type processing-associated H-X9-DG protein
MLADSRPRPSSANAFTLVEMLLVVAVIALLISILLPSLNKAKQATHRTLCSTKLHHLSLANIGYIQDNRNTFPPHRQLDMSLNQNWFNLLEEFGNNREVSHCPAIESQQQDYGVKWNWAYNFNYLGYGYNGFFLGLYSHPEGSSFGTFIRPRQFCRMGFVKDPGKLIVHADRAVKTANGQDYGVGFSMWWPFINAYKEGVNSNRHGNAGVVSFADGHAAVVIDPDNTIHPKIDGTTEHIEYWDPAQRQP